MAFEFISSIERGETAPNLSTLADITDAIGPSIRDFFDIDDTDLTDGQQSLLMRINRLVTEVPIFNNEKSYDIPPFSSRDRKLP